MGTTYRIAEVADRSGFTPATLRYYEDIGLVAPAGRTAAGYRLYDDTSLDRLRLVARAKRLGCTLEEVADLAAAWEGGECGPVQDRLRTTVEAKAAEAEGRAAELAAFAADLRRAAAGLGAHRPDGPCDDACGCTSDPTPGTPRTPVTPGAGASVGVALVPKADAGAEAPAIACELGGDDRAERVEEWRALLDGDGDGEEDRRRGVVARRGLGDGVRLEFGPDADPGEIARLAAAEQGCCRFFRFALVVDGRGVALEVHAPPDAADAVTSLFGAADTAGS